MKRAQSLSDALAPEPKKRNVAYATYQGWKTDMDRECLTVTWLDYDVELSGRKKTVDAVYVPSSRQELLLEETSVNDGFVVPSQYAPATFATMLEQCQLATAYIAAVGASTHTHDTVK